MTKNIFFGEFTPSTKQDWKELVIKDLKGADFNEKMLWNSIDGFIAEPFYTLEDIKNLNHLKANPAEFPFVRGNKSDSNSWQICQKVIVKKIKDANKTAVNAVSKGADGIEFVLAVLLNEDDFSNLLKNIALEKIYLHFSGSHAYSVLLQLLEKEAKKRNIDTNNIKGSLNFDSFSYYLLNGNYYNSFEDNMNELQCLLKIANEQFKNFHILTVNGHHFHNAGASIVQELAFTLSSANDYIYNMLEKGMSLEDILPRIRFSFATGSSYFPEIAKIRAARMLWSEIVKQYNPANAQLCKVNIHSTTSLLNKTACEPYNNVLRGTTETMSAVLGGVDSFTVNPHDFTYKDTDSFSERIARNIQLILKEEAYFDKVVDPAAGSYYIENLTVSIASNAWKLFLKIEKMGGFVKAMELLFIKQEIEKCILSKKQG